MPSGDLYALAEKYRRELAAGDQAAADRLVRAYGRISQRLLSDQQALLARIQEVRREGHAIPKGWLYQEARYKTLIETAQREIGTYSMYAHAVVADETRRAAGLAVLHSQGLIEAAVAETTPGLTVSLLGVNAANVAQVLAFTSAGSPLAALLDSLGADTAQAMQSALLNGLGQGWSVARIASAMRVAGNLPRSRAMLIARTETLRAYRETSRLSYEANSDVVSGWTWHCALDSRCCGACAIMSGTEHPVTDTLDGHPRCRCAMVPRTRTWADLGIEGRGGARPEPVQGREWLLAQPAGVQQAILGPGKYAALQRGEISLDDIVARTFDPRWGSMRHERSLAAIRALHRRRRRRG